MALLPFFVFALVAVQGPARQDTIPTKKPSLRVEDNMPVRRGRGTSGRMPSPRYDRLPRDTVKTERDKRFDTR